MPPEVSNRGSRRQGLRRGSYKSPPWVGYELDSRENVDRFLQDTIRETWTGRLGTRQASSINGSVRLLLELRGWTQKTPFQVIQAKAVRPSRTFTLQELSHTMEDLPIETQETFIKKLRGKHVKVGSATSSRKS